MAALLMLDGLEKNYGAVRAVAGVSLAFEAGRVHAVVGQNGAGKSTLLMMAAGIVVPDGGEVRVDGARLVPHTAREAIRRGVAMVQQHFALAGALSVLENVMLGSEPTRPFGVLDFEAARRRAEAAAHEIGVSLPWDAQVDSLGVGDKQRLEIVRTLVRDARVIILDEPTAVLTRGEAAALYAALRRLAHAGRAIIAITHRLDEVAEYADTVAVMRRGALISTRALGPGADVIATVTREIMDGEAPRAVARRARTLGDVRLTVRDARRGERLNGASFVVRAGEIVGIAGVEGNGQRELVRLVSGLDEPRHGEISTASVAVVHEDRRAEGLVLDATVRDNLVLGELGRFSRLGFVNGDALDREARGRLAAARIVPPDLDSPVRHLSGGNQQKVVVARAVARTLGGHPPAGVLLLAQPTRGVDLGTARAIHSEILRAADQGSAVLVVSSDLSELREVCDRILVMSRGRIAAELAPDASEALFGDAMLGRPAQREQRETPSGTPSETDP